MRITGLGLLAYFVGHIYETSTILQGKASWNEMLAMTQTVEGHAFLALVIGMCVFHTANRAAYANARLWRMVLASTYACISISSSDYAPMSQNERPNWNSLLF